MKKGVQEELDKMFGDLNISSTLNSIKNVVDEIGSDDISEFYHMGKYTTKEYAWGYLMTYNIAGANRENISISLKDGILTLSIKESDLFKAFKDTIWIPKGIDRARVSVKYTNGLLEVSLPRFIKSNDDNIEITVD